MTDKGRCKHGEFVLTEGCPDCLAESRQKIKDRISEGIEGIGESRATEDVHYNTNNPEDGNIETALALRPGADVEAIDYYNEALELLKYAEARVITTADDAKVATDDLSSIAKLKKVMENKRRSLLDPLKLQADAIRATYDYLMMPIIHADRLTREKMLSYRAEQERIRAEQEAIAKMKQETAEREAKLTGKPVEAPEVVAVAPEAPKSIETAMGAAGKVDHWKYEVVDFSQLPNEYKLPDSAMLNSIAKKHHDQKVIPGVRFYNEPIIAVRAKG